MGEERTGHDLDRLTVAEAASVLSISQDAVRKHIARGTISHDRDESGFLPSDEAVSAVAKALLAAFLGAASCSATSDAR